MPIDIRCTGCRQKFRVADRHAGREVDCPKCGEKMTIPGGDSDKSAPPPHDQTFDDAIFSESSASGEMPVESPPEPPPVVPLAASKQPVFEYDDGSADKKKIGEVGVDSTPKPPAIPYVELGPKPTPVDPSPTPPVDPSMTAPTEDTSENVPEQPQTDEPIWTLLSAADQEFGPVTRAELDLWFAQGRIDSQCQIYCEGWAQWKWADTVYPQLTSAIPGGTIGNPNANLQPGAAGSPSSLPHFSDIVQEFRKTRLWIFISAGIGFFFASVAAVLGIIDLWKTFTADQTPPMAYLFINFISAIVFGFISYLLLRVGLNINRLVSDPNEEQMKKTVRAGRLFWQVNALAISIYVAVTVLGLVGMWIIGSIMKG